MDLQELLTMEQRRSQVLEEKYNLALQQRDFVIELWSRTLNEQAAATCLAIPIPVVPFQRTSVHSIVTGPFNLPFGACLPIGLPNFATRSQRPSGLAKDYRRQPRNTGPGTRDIRYLELWKQYGK